MPTCTLCKHAITALAAAGTLETLHVNGYTHYIARMLCLCPGVRGPSTAGEGVLQFAVLGQTRGEAVGQLAQSPPRAIAPGRVNAGPASQVLCQTPETHTVIIKVSICLVCTPSRFVFLSDFTPLRPCTLTVSAPCSHGSGHTGFMSHTHIGTFTLHHTKTFPWSHFQCIPTTPVTSSSASVKDLSVVCLLCRRYFYLQLLRSSLLEDREAVFQDDQIALAALSLQADLGDCRQTGSDLSRCAPHLLHLQHSTQLAVLDRYRELRGLGAAVAVDQFLDKAQRLESYGIECHPVVDSKGRPWTVAVGPSSIVVTNEFTHAHTR